jgi:hypothetical protein
MSHLKEMNCVSCFPRRPGLLLLAVASLGPSWQIYDVQLRQKYDSFIHILIIECSLQICNCTDKGKGHPITGHQGPRGGVDV